MFSSHGSKGDPGSYNRKLQVDRPKKVTISSNVDSTTDVGLDLLKSENLSPRHETPKI